MQLNYFVWMIWAMQWTFSVTTTGHAPGPSCCTQISTNRVRVKEIAKYIHQDKPLCRIKAVRFTLRNKNTICSNPEDPWAKHVIEVLNKGTPPSLASTSGTETITSRSSPRPSTESTIHMTTPKGSSTTWKLGTFITHGSSPKQTSGNTNKPSQTTTTHITPIKMTPSTATTTITTEGTPSTTNIETTSTSMTTESPVTMTATTLRPRTTVTHKYSTEQSTKAQITTFSVTTTTMKEKTAENGMTMTAPRGTSTTESSVQKSSTRNLKTPTTSCRTTMSSATTKKKKIPWTVRRLRKKTKTGLRRAQMNLKTNMC